MRRIVGLRQQMLLVFTILLVVTGSIIALSFAVLYRHSYAEISKTYLSDATKQTTNNLENRIHAVEEIHMQLLTNTVIQQWMIDVNETEVDSYKLRNIKQIIERELEPYVLIGSDVISVSVVTLNDYAFSVNKITGRGIDFGFSEEEIYAAKGTSLWGLVGPNNDICIARAVFNLSTMKPIGYINMVYEAAYFDEIVKDNSTQFSGASYVMDTTGTIITSNYEDFIGMKFPKTVGELKESATYQSDILDEGDFFYYIGNEMENGWTLVEMVSVKEFYRRTNQIFFITGMALVAILVCGIVSVHMVTKRIAKPTQELLESIKWFGKGDLSQRVKVEAQDEVGQIAKEYNRMADNIETLIQKVYKMEISQKQAEIDFLCMQINPHFLYNALDTISWSAIAQGNEEVSEITIALADLLRAMLKKERFITLEEEMKTAKDYLTIQKRRFGDKITVIDAIDERAYAYQVPNFLIQPLIENAILHGIEPKLEKGNLRIEIRVAEAYLHFKIEDDGVGMSEERIRELYRQCERNDTKQSIGLKNVYRRLILCYGEESRLYISSKLGIGTMVHFQIPITKET